MGWLIIVVVVYALVMIAGGVGGYASARSMASLITGVGSGVLLLVGATFAKTNPKVGFGLCAVVTLVLIGFFASKAMGGGAAAARNWGLTGLSVAVLLALVFGHFATRNS